MSSGVVEEDNNKNIWKGYAYKHSLIFPTCMKATVENPRSTVEKLSPKASVEGKDTVLRGSVRAPKGFSEGKPEAAKPRGLRPLGEVWASHTVI